MHLLSQLFSHCPPLVHTCSSFILTQVFCSRTTSHVEVKLCVAVQLDFDHWLVSNQKDAGVCWTGPKKVLLDKFLENINKWSQNIPGMFMHKAFEDHVHLLPHRCVFLHFESAPGLGPCYVTCCILLSCSWLFLPAVLETAWLQMRHCPPPCCSSAVYCAHIFITDAPVVLG